MRSKMFDSRVGSTTLYHKTDYERDRETVEDSAAGAKALLPGIKLLTASVSDAPYEWNRGRSVGSAM